MKNTLLLLVAIAALLFTGTQRAAAQSGMAVNTTAAAADNSAMLDVSSTTKGMLVPRMTNAQRNAISTPATGLLIYQTDGTAGFYYYNGSSWTAVGGGATGSAGGDLTGTYPNPTIASGATTGANIATALNASSSTVSAARLGSGTANANTLLHGNSTWSAVSLSSDVTGNLPVGNLNGGSGASSSTFWRGDGTWASPTVVQTEMFTFAATCPNSAIANHGSLNGSTFFTTAGFPNDLRATVMGYSGTATTLRARVYHRAGVGTNNVQVTVYKNNAATSMVINIASNSVGSYFTDTDSNSFTFSAGDVISYVMTQDNAATVTDEISLTLVVTH